MKYNTCKQRALELVRYHKFTQTTLLLRSAIRFFFSLFFFLPPSVPTARNRPPTVKIDHYWSISGGNGVEIAPIDGTALWRAIRISISWRTDIYRPVRNDNP
ncbi:hypothetical protein B296_00024163 [Ensete ventricosum]|uniref:Uncharacterized protein n=1 Tax=Ensete ventricosum TaxID=4639 RepID=A0A426YQ13_ENSVE|nr:hypothetical protein B296_00024163 [Ensete ventricosum]